MQRFIEVTQSATLSRSIEISFNQLREFFPQVPKDLAAARCYVHRQEQRHTRAWAEFVRALDERPWTEAQQTGSRFVIHDSEWLNGPSRPSIRSIVAGLKEVA